MTDLKNGSMLMLLPEERRKSAETSAFSYAVDGQIRKVLAFADGIQFYASMDKMPGYILDLLAVELRTPGYKESYSTELKRELIRQSLPFWSKMGTPEAVNRIMEAVFGNGTIEEFWEYDTTPHHFRARTGNPHITKENVDEFIDVINSVKRKTSWLDEVALGTSAETFRQYIGFFVCAGEIVRTLPAEL